MIQSMIVVTVNIIAVFLVMTLGNVVLAETYRGVENKDRAQTHYMLNCQGCHLPDGTGYGNKVPDMKNQLGRFLTVNGGREFLVQVPGSATAPLSDKALAELLNWMLFTYSKEQVPDNFKPYTPQEVAELRAQPLREVEDRRAILVKQFK